MGPYTLHSLTNSCAHCQVIIDENLLNILIDNDSIQVIEAPDDSDRVVAILRG